MVFPAMECSSDSESGESGDSGNEGLPTPAAIGRDRSVRDTKRKKPQPQNVRASERKLKKKSIYVRIAEFPGKGLEMRDGSLFCEFCRDCQSEKKSSVVAHMKSKKHTSSKEKAKREKLRQQSLTQALSRRGGWLEKHCQ